MCPLVSGPNTAGGVYLYGVGVCLLTNSVIHA